MTLVAEMMQRGGGGSLLLIPSAVVLGALHGLEPGHSKTLMAAFIVAVRGTVGQAVLLGLAATVAHSAVVWAIALGGLYLFSGLDVEAAEPYMQVASAALIIAIACWMLYRTWRERQEIRAASDHMDAHARGHADEIRRRFANRGATTGQIVMFGLTGGLIPCPAAITVLLLCLQVRQIGVGAALVLAFSLGLALTMVAAGVAAAIGVKHLSKRFDGFGALAARAPYLSSAVIICVGFYLGIAGLRALSAAGAI